MAVGPAIVLASLFLEDGDGACSTLADNLGLDAGPLDHRLSDLYALVAMNQSNMAEFNHASDFAAKRLHLDQGSSFDPILLATCLNEYKKPSMPAAIANCPARVEKDL